ncbi:hypothetical protein, partial [Dokdonella sp.]|uniref:hypothetical protein n=1 Tax=Dokdonella sp. TaxID=2291710 RepID=UPI0031C8821B|nr:hypothetical protein [Dokdonella sp.]
MSTQYRPTSPASRWTRWLSSTLLAFLCVGALPAMAATTWYVRADGGTPAQCTGRSDAAYPGSGSNQA